MTLKDVPEYMVAGKSVSLTYAVRQHGVHLTPGLSGWIEARDARGAIVKALATPASDTGYYLAKLTLPTPATGRSRSHSGFIESKSAPSRCGSSRAAIRSPRLADAERGKLLFAAKGCTSCHTHTGVSNPTAWASRRTSAHRGFAAPYLKTFLADPSIKTPSRPGLMMPNLQLTHGEIGALVAFLSVDAKQSARGSLRPTGTRSSFRRPCCPIRCRPPSADTGRADGFARPRRSTVSRRSVDSARHRARTSSRWRRPNRPCPGPCRRRSAARLADRNVLR